MADPITIISLIVSVASAVYSVTRSVPDNSNEDIGASVVKQGSASPRNVVYGRCRVSSTKLYSNVLNTRSDVMLQVFGIGGIGRLTSIHQCWIEDKPVLVSDIDLQTDPTKLYEGYCSNVNEAIDSSDPLSPNWPIVSKLTTDFGGQVSLQFRNGALSERASELATKYGDGEWTSNHRGDLVPHVAVKVLRKIDADGVVITNPQYKIQCEVSGITVYDPRNDTTEWTDNPALCLMDYLIAGSDLNDHERYYGMAVPVEYINVQSFIDAANFCDDNDLTINAEIQGDQTYGDILDKFLSTFDGILTIENGQIACKFEQQELPVASFNEDNIVGNFGYTNQSSSNYHNAVSVSYKSYINAEEEDEFVLPANFYTDPIISSDGYIKKKSVKMPYTIDARTLASDGTGVGLVNGPVKWMANREYSRSQFQKEVTFDVDLIENPVNIYDVISVSHGEYLLENKLFRIKSMKKSVDGDKLNIATIKASEYDLSIYTGNQDGTGSKPKPTPIPIDSPTALNFNVTNFISFGYGTLSWQCLYNSTQRLFDVEYRLSSVSTWTRLGTTDNLDYKIAGLKSDRYDFRVRTRDPYIGSSNFTELLDVDVGTNVVLPPVTNLVVNAVTRNFHFQWDSMLDQSAMVPDPTSPDQPTNGLVSDVFSHYQVDIFHIVGGSPQLVKTYNVTDPQMLYTFEMNSDNGLNRSVRADVYIVAKEGSKSQIESGSRVTGTNPQVVTPNDALSVTGELSTFTIEWNAITDSDYYGTEVHISTDPSFTPIPGSPTHVVQGSSLTFSTNDKIVRYVRVGHYDVFGTGGITYSSRETLTPRSIDDILPDIPAELDKLRDPANAYTDTGEYALTVASPSKKVTAGFGLYARDDGTSDAIIAADRLMVSTGGHADYQSSLSYSTGQRVYIGVYPNRSMYQAKRSVPANVSPPNNTYWTLLNSNVDQAAFYVDTANETLYIRNAVVKDLTTTNIQTGSLTGVELSASFTITAGTGNNIAKMSGSGSTRFWAGHASSASAPFRVEQNGDIISNRTISAGTGNNIAKMSGNDTYRFWAGHASSASAPFRVHQNGTVDIRSSTSTSTSRLVINGDRLEVYEGSTLKVRIGRL